jgi:Fe2+ or Zn2+ uptake regulation protein
MKGTLNTNAQAVLNVVKEAHNHPTASDIYEAVRETRPRMGLASVYRILRMLVAQGWIKEVRHNDETCRYDARTDRHDHAVCTACGKLIDLPVDISIPQDLLASAAKDVDIVLNSYELRLFGICSACSQNVRVVWPDLKE